MSFNIESLRSQIVKALEGAEFKEQATVSITGPSNVSHENPHRFILQEIRSDLIHFDGEKKNRIIFMVNQHLSTQKPSPELEALLLRVLEVVTEYNLTGKILTSPQKKSRPPEYSTSSESPRSARTLFPKLTSEIDEFNS